MMTNPYRTDYPGMAPFFGRKKELGRLVESLATGRDSIAAVMGGRGMGKTSLALHLEELLPEACGRQIVFVRSPSPEPERFLEQVGRQIGRPLSPTLPTESLIEAIESVKAEGVVLLVDEIEHVISSPVGRGLLDNLRVAWEALRGKLGLVIFGGSMLRDLLSSDVSPFLRSAQWIPLRGLGIGETAALLREPCDLAVPDDLVEAIWEQTDGHPLLLQAIMARAVVGGAPILDRLPQAIIEVRDSVLEPTVFPIWWDNLRDRGQELYRKLWSLKRPLSRADLVCALGGEPHPWVEILETTGVARLTDGEFLTRGEMFRTWFEHTHARVPASPPPDDVAGVSGLNPDTLSPFETLVVRAISRWARCVVEYPVDALKSGAAAGNQRLLPEVHFQLGLLRALIQVDILVEAEGLSSAGGRTDLKIRSSAAFEGADRACVELKIWDRNDYKETVDQLLAYAVPTDRFGCVVMLDRQARSLLEPYCNVLRLGTTSRLLWPGGSTEPRVRYPAYLSEHDRSVGTPLRIYHFLVQLPPD